MLKSSQAARWEVRGDSSYQIRNGTDSHRVFVQLFRYASEAYRKLCKDNNIVLSMSRRGIAMIMPTSNLGLAALRRSAYTAVNIQQSLSYEHSFLTTLKFGTIGEESAQHLTT